MAIVLTNATLADIDPIGIESGGLRIDGGRIVARGSSVSAEPGDEVVDCGGCVVLPGLVNGHTHLYSALATGMPAPPRAPSNFLEILRYVWWRLDRALDAGSIEMSARIGALDALRCGTTTLIDHHASPNCIAGSLDLIERGLADVGLRGVLCYETTDRHGPEGRAAGLDENRRYLGKCKAARNGRFAAIVGAHASFTLEDETLGRLAALAEQFDTGVHIHVAEDPCDAADAVARLTRLKAASGGTTHTASAGPAGHWPAAAPVRKKVDPAATTVSAAERDSALIDRLAKHFLIQPDSIFAHGTHLNAHAIAKVNEMGVAMAHNPRSNMNNAVGYAPVAAFECPVMLGTDGIGADLFTEAKAAWFVSRHAHSPAHPPAAGALSPDDIVGMLAASARKASRLLGVTLGKLEVGATADIVVTDYAPSTPLSSENLAGHFIFGLTSNHVRSVLVDGAWRLRDRGVVDRDEATDRSAARETANGLWQRMAALALD